VAASADGEWALAADKFGDVYVAPLRSAERASASDSKADPAAAPSDAAAANGQQSGGTSHDSKAAIAPQPASAAGSKAALLLGHYNATITSLTVSADGGSLVSTDRDGKARVNVLPSNPLQVRKPLRVVAANLDCYKTKCFCCCTFWICRWAGCGFDDELGGVGSQRDPQLLRRPHAVRLLLGFHQPGRRVAARDGQRRWFCQACTLSCTAAASLVVAS